jgi:phenylacetate-CoA ligase
MKSVYTTLVSGLVFPVQEHFKKHSTVAVRRRLEETQWLPADRLQALQNERLHRLLVGAGRHVPYYRDLFAQAGFKPETVSGSADLQKLPFLTKAVIRKEGDRMKSDVARGLARFNTGGSSGEPLIFDIGKERFSHDVAAKWRATRWWGVDIGNLEIVVWGSPIELR